MTHFLLKTPFFRIVLALIAGILLFSYFPLSELILPFFLLGSFAFAAHFYFQYKKQQFKFRWLFGSGILFFCIALGMLITKQNEHKNRFENLDKQGLFQVEIASAPVNKPKTFLVKVKIAAFAADSIHFQPSQGNAILYLAKTSVSKNLRIGDKIIICGKLQAPKQSNNPEEFNYATYLARKGIGASAYIDSTHCTLLKRNTKFSLFQYATDLRNKLLEVYKAQRIDGDEFAVLAALTLGYQDEIQDELYSSYSNSGAIHILSVSGLHVGIIYLVFVFLLSFLNKSTQTRVLKSILIILLLCGYALLTGLSPSVLRATIMFSLLAFASIFNSKSQIYNTLFFSAFILLLYNPNYIFDVSFLLSYMAVLSIVFFHPRIKKLVHFKSKPLAWCWELFSVSIAAQIGTFPLVIFLFHKFANHFLLTNFIAIPISTAIIYLALLLFLVAPITILASWVGIALNCLLKAQNASIVFIDHLPFSTFQLWINELETCLLYAFIVLITVFALKKRFALLMFALLCFITIQISYWYRSIQSYQQTEVVVYANSKLTAVDFIDGNTHYTFTTDSAKLNRIAQNFWLKRRLSKPIYINKSEKFQNGFFVFENKRFCIVTDSLYANKTTDNPLAIDYLILGENNQLNISDIERLFIPKLIIIDDTNLAWKAKKLSQKCSERGIQYYSMKEKGCLTIKLGLIR